MTSCDTNKECAELLAQAIAKAGHAPGAPVRLEPYDDGFFDDHLRLRLALYPTPTRLLTSTEYGMQSYREMLASESAGVTLAVLDGASGTFVGEVVVHDFEKAPWEVGWDVLPEHQCKGYATAAGAELIARLKELPGCPGVSARVDASNAASIRVAQKLGGTQACATAGERSPATDLIARLAREYGQSLTDEARAVVDEFLAKAEEPSASVIVFEFS